jgi:hypothetical protein
MKLIISTSILIASLFNFADSRRDLVSGTFNKAWFLFAITPESQTATCKSSSAISRDNTYTFFADGRFAFDHGTITEDPNCTQENCCGDFVNLEGMWEFTNNETGLRVTVLREAGAIVDGQKFILYDCAIDLLTEDVLKISQVNPLTKKRHSVEFRKK